MTPFGLFLVFAQAPIFVGDAVGKGGEYRVVHAKNPRTRWWAALAPADNSPGETITRTFKATDGTKITVSIRRNRNIVGLQAGEGASPIGVSVGKSWSGIPIGERLATIVLLNSDLQVRSAIRDFEVKVDYSRYATHRVEATGLVQRPVPEFTTTLVNRNVEADKPIIEGVARNVCARLFPVENAEVAHDAGLYFRLEDLHLPTQVSAHYNEPEGTIDFSKEGHTLRIPVGSRLGLGEQDPSFITSYLDAEGRLMVYQPAIDYIAADLRKL